MAAVLLGIGARRWTKGTRRSVRIAAETAITLGILALAFVLALAAVLFAALTETR